MNQMDNVIKIFPNWRYFPENSMTPVVVKFDDESKVFFLIKGSYDALEDFIKEPPDSDVIIHVTLSTEPNEKGKVDDIAIRFDFYFETGHPYFVSVIYGYIDRKDILLTLLYIEFLNVFIITNEGEYIKSMRITWDVDVHKPLIQRFIKEDII